MGKIKSKHIRWGIIVIAVVYLGQGIIFKEIAKGKVMDEAQTYYTASGEAVRVPETQYVVVGNRVYFYRTDKASSSDVNRMYRMREADAETFEEIPSGSAIHYAKDKYHVYTGTFVIPNADPNTFELLSFNYSKDKNNYYYGTDVTTEAQYKEFIFMQNGRSLPVEFEDALGLNDPDSKLYMAVKNLPFEEPNFTENMNIILVGCGSGCAWPYLYYRATGSAAPFPKEIIEGGLDKNLEIAMDVPEIESSRNSETLSIKKRDKNGNIYENRWKFVGKSFVEVQ